jgi:predicted transposase YbfD/YdcC
MHHTTETFWTLELPESGFVFDLGSLYDRFEQLTDARHARGKRYALALLLSLMTLAKLSGEDSPHGMAEWVRLHQAELQELLPLTRESSPCANTYRTTASHTVEPNAVQQVFSDFLAAQPHAGQSVLLCIDGKTLRGSLSASHPTGVHLLAAYLPAEGLVLMPVAVEPSTNEISVAPRLLKSLDLRGKIVMGDALHTQRALSLQIVEAGGEYVWYAKGNQPRLQQDIAQTFPVEGGDAGIQPPPTHCQRASESDKGHGRIEKRTLTTSSLLQGYVDWPQVAQVFKLERQVWDWHHRLLRSEVVYGLTSLTAAEASPARLLQLTRAYWGIESGLHYRRDVSLHEDATRMGQPRAAQVWASLNNLLIGVHTRLGFDDLPQARRFFAAHLPEAVAVLTRRTL